MRLETDAIEKLEWYAMLEPALADEGLAPRLDLLAHRRLDHVVIVGGDLIMQALGRMCQQVAMLVNRASSTARQRQASVLSLPMALIAAGSSGRRRAHR
jgi:hypothetical protein